MKKYSSFLMGITIVSVLIFIISFLTVCDTKDALNLAASLLTALSSIGTIIIGYIIYRDIGISKKITEKQTEVVLQYLAELRTIRISYALVRNGKVLMFGNTQCNKNWINVHLDDQSSFYNSFNYLDTKISINVGNYINELANLNKIANNLYMPPEFTERLSLFQFSSATLQATDLRIVINSDAMSFNEWSVLHHQEITYREYLTSIQDILDELVKWIQKHSPEQLPNLNL